MATEEQHLAVERCPGCRGLFPLDDAPTHEYIEAAPGCWKRYGAVLAREYGEWNMPPAHRLTVDAYAAQHPGGADRRAIQSTWVHLVALQFVLEDGRSNDFAKDSMSRLATRAESLWRLEPPPDPDWLTVEHVAAASDLADYERRAREWAESVWNAWSSHHEEIRKISRMALPGM